MPPAKKTPAKKTSGKPAPNTKAPAGSYALPGGGPGGADAYPIHDRAHGANALARVQQNGTPEEKAKVRAKVRAKYPDLPSSQGKGQSAAAKAQPSPGKSKPRARKS
jgi:hypothetical protein